MAEPFTSPRSRHRAGAASPDHAAVLRRLDLVATLMDNRFRIPGTRWHFGLDGLVGMIPGIGDAAGAIVSGWIILEARRLGVPTPLLLKMLANLGIDMAVGAVPVLGDLFDFAWKANRRNVDLLRQHLDDL